MSWVLQRDSSCEHCGELEPYTLTWDDRTVTWCEACADACDYDLPDLEKWQEKARKSKIAYFKRRVRELEK